MTKEDFYLLQLRKFLWFLEVLLTKDISKIETIKLELEKEGIDKKLIEFDIIDEIDEKFLSSQPIEILIGLITYQVKLLENTLESKHYEKMRMKLKKIYDIYTKNSTQYHYYLAERVQKLLN